METIDGTHPEPVCYFVSLADDGSPSMACEATLLLAGGGDTPAIAYRVFSLWAPSLSRVNHSSAIRPCMTPPGEYGFFDSETGIWVTSCSDTAEAYARSVRGAESTASQDLSLLGRSTAGRIVRLGLSGDDHLYELETNADGQTTCNRYDLAGNLVSLERFPDQTEAIHQLNPLSYVAVSASRRIRSFINSNDGLVQSIRISLSEVECPSMLAFSSTRVITDSNTGNWKTTDNTANWAIAVGGAGVAYAVMIDSVSTSDYRNNTAIWKTTDNGATWTKVPVTVALDETGAVYAVMAEFDNRAIYSSNTGIWETTDNGATWTKMAESLGLNPDNPWSAVVIGSLNIPDSENGCVSKRLPDVIAIAATGTKIQIGALVRPTLSELVSQIERNDDPTSLETCESGMRATLDEVRGIHMYDYFRSASGLCPQFEPPEPMPGKLGSSSQIPKRGAIHRWSDQLMVQITCCEEVGDAIEMRDLPIVVHTGEITGRMKVNRATHLRQGYGDWGDRDGPDVEARFQVAS